MKKNDDYIIFMGAKLTKLQANRSGIGILCGIIGILLSLILPFNEYKFINYMIILLFVMVGYFIIGPKIFKK